MHLIVVFGLTRIQEVDQTMHLMGFFGQTRFHEVDQIMLIVSSADLHAAKANQPCFIMPRLALVYFLFQICWI